MDFIDRPPPAPMPAARIRTLYAQNPTDEARAMAWEIWRLQRVIVALEAGLAHAARASPARHPRPGERTARVRPGKTLFE